MTKKYVTARLFKKNKEAENQIYREEVSDSEQQSAEILNNSQEKNKTSDSLQTNSDKLPLHHEFLKIIQKTKALLGIDHQSE